MEALEALSNEDLHRELLKQGFPNMPVTSTTRKVLLRKLKLKMENGSAPAPPKNSRRETIDVTKFSSDEEPDEKLVIKITKKKEEFNRRQTVGGEKLSNAISTSVPSSNSKRRSGRITPLSEQQSQSYASPARKTPAKEIAEEESDDDEIRFVVERRPPSVTERRSKSKSPSLSKSDTITTSYKHIPAVPTILESPLIIEDEFEEPDDEEDDFYDEPVPEKVENRYQPSTVTSRYSEFSRKTDSGWQNRRPISISGGGQQQTSSFDYNEDPLLSGLSYRKPEASPMVSLSRASTAAAYASPIPSYLASERYSSANYKSPVGAGGDGFAETDVNQSPYLSNFTRRLSTLQAAPLNSVQHTRSTFARTYQSAAGGGKASETLWDNFKHVVLALQRKYKLHFSVLLIALVLLFVFVFFFM